MTDKLVLVTGGAGFIGSHVSDELLRNGYRVRVLDSLVPQVHGDISAPPVYLSSAVEFVRGDVRDANLLQQTLHGVDAVIHLAAAVGVGQSMYEMAHYTSVNDLGTSILLEALAKHPVEKLVVASSMSIYGEGLYQASATGVGSSQPVTPGLRRREQLMRGEWELVDASGVALTPLPTPETKAPELSSIYALSKYVQEKQCLIWGEAYRIPTIALRFFNVYGPRQALSNPYTGVLAIFAARFLSGQPPMVYEDGSQQRDFVHVEDVSRACRLALESTRVDCDYFNIGSGNAISVMDVADEMALVLNCQQLKAEIVGKYRVGDIRHCFADISKAQRLLDYEPEVSFIAGLQELAEWLVQQDRVDSTGVQAARDELTSRGLLV
jgi:dTDP-L-rhamnose 4-epimerase